MCKEFKQLHFTFEYTYADTETLNGTNSVQFCAESRQEADDLFRCFCKDENLPLDLKPKSVEVVYNEADAEAYRKESVGYGTPEEYDELQTALAEIREKLDEHMNLYILENDGSRLRNYYYNPEANDGDGNIEEDVLYYEQIAEYLDSLDEQIAEYSDSLDKTDTESILWMEGQGYSYPLNNANGYNDALTFLEGIEDAVNKKPGCENMLAISSKTENFNETLSSFLHERLDNPKEKKEGKNFPAKE